MKFFNSVKSIYECQEFDIISFEYGYEFGKQFHFISIVSMPSIIRYISQILRTYYLFSGHFLLYF